MADTRQIVNWAIERACPMREGADWTDPVQTRQRLYQLQRCAERMQGGDIVDGIWVTSTYWGNDAAEKTVNIPCSGIRIDEVARPFGGWDIVRGACRNCEANVAHRSRDSVAGCHESLDVMHPYSEQLDALLWETVRLHGLESRIRASFEVTTPLWFGFWINSPLNRQQCELLLELLPRSLPRLWGKDESGNDVAPIFETSQFVFSDFNPSEAYGREFQAFFHALRAAIDWELPLHVLMAPPGHVDLGFYTQFAHCPRCKAEARIARWSESVESHMCQCEVCGHDYDPSTTCRSEPDEYDLDRDSLERQLGDQYDAFAIRYGLLKGLSEQQMVEALDNHRDGPRRREVRQCRRRVSRLAHEYAEKSGLPKAADLPKELVLEIAPGVVLEMIRIMPGQFLMGSDDNEQEQPIHVVTIAEPYYMGRFPITQAQWEAVMGSNPSRCRGQSNLPVEQVTWFSAQGFCAQLSETIGRHLRLPSEAEWEYACRAGTSTRFWCGDDITAEQANFDASLKSPDDFLLASERDEPPKETTPVDQFPPNPWGLYDMHGNVEEWCQDSWHDSYEGAPEDGSAWVDPDEPVEHVARGGAAYTIGTACRSAARRKQRANCGAREYAPADEDEDSSSFLRSMFDFTEYYGVRVVCLPRRSDIEP